MYEDDLGLGRLIKRLGWQRFQKRLLIVSWILAVVGAIGFVLPFVIEQPPYQALTKTFGGMFIGVVSLLSFVFGLTGIICTPTWRRHYTALESAFDFSETYDRMTLAPYQTVPDIDLVTLATFQPVPDIEALTLPTRIDQKPRILRTLIYLIVLTLLITAIYLPAFLITHSLLALIIFLLWIFPYACLFIVAIVTLALGRGLTIFSVNQLISISEDVIATSLGSLGSKAIAWDDVRIFAIVKGGNRISPDIVYSLSSGDHEVRWKHRLRTHWYSLAAPTTSDEVYNRQMEALLSYATARTGLPLLDMR
ncbi:MAG TPA: hypothetical protein VFX24_12980 [Ktedonobacterales bacterium]|nr:hypothetical protein [Ktedonobacterales bacterium]